ncbi:hypothetical protein, partial [Anaerovibrio slackiae]|uniref:hypothetical protein n=1 Tax=Anaerovibrio slackiae TaxID=2652309 RepID=UPI0038691798
CQGELHPGQQKRIHTFPSFSFTAEKRFSIDYKYNQFSLLFIRPKGKNPAKNEKNTQNLAKSRPGRYHGHTIMIIFRPGSRSGFIQLFPAY